ncbi:hypothetical protein [Polyangium mundeleinium]|uniref:Uncharacterized protein n=1 Tax=Polyangium mundeleinium TaxID=2995306 RepID=A0ABT5F1Z8_9BACT|nr:hypothetical protein [Polyangium mundeleinium]MDC0747115.1 hypothetical protein [Polyangium mundeleinium]
MADNFDSFKKAVREGWTEEEAARDHTFTGIMAGRAGFKNVTIIENNEQRVVVEFYR